MLNNIIDDENFSNKMRQMYDDVLKYSDILDNIFDEVCDDISNIYPDTVVSEDKEKCVVNLSDKSTVSDVKNQIDTIINEKMTKHSKAEILPIIAFRVLVTPSSVYFSKRY